MKILKDSSIAFLIFSTITFSQVVYQGPATGTVDTGVVITTDDFLSLPIGNEPIAEGRIVPFMEHDPGPVYHNDNEFVNDNYVYVEDENTKLQRGGVIGTSFELQSFPSIPMTNSFPPDNHHAVGPNHVITTVNSRFHIYDLEGNLLKNISADSWCSPALPNPGAFDPQIIYDHYEGRWFMLWDNQSGATQTAFFIISYSDDEDPLGTWYEYALDATKNGTGNTSTWGDYPQIGYDDQAIYIMSRQFSFAGSYQHNKIRILNKSELYTANTGPVSWTDMWDITNPSGFNRPDVIHPTISYDVGLNTAYFVWSNSNSSTVYYLYKIADPIISPVLTGVNISSTFYGSPPLANQLGGGTLIESGGARIRNAPILRDNKIYAVHAMRNSQFTGYSSIKYIVLDINTNALLEEVEQGANGYFHFYPAIAVDLDHNLAITYSRSADTEYVGAYYSTKLGTDPPGLSPSKTMMEGQGNYQLVGSNRNRWGDYLSAALHPVNQYNIWLFSEYAAATNQWGTWLTEIRMKAFPGVHGELSDEELNFGNIEVGFTSDLISTIIANYGEQDLMITDIPSSVGDFNLETSFTPITLSTYDSLQLEFSFSPTVTGEVMETYTITTNDPMFTGPTLIGNGFEIFPALTKTIYASSGSENNGDILTIDKTAGAGTILGPSLFDEIKSISIDPNSGTIYGLNARTPDSDIVRVNSGEGDSYFLFTLDIQLLAGIAFDTTGTLYTITRSGDIYTVDLTTGSTTFVVDAVSSYAGITFNPLTNELWASAQSFVLNKDAVFTVDLGTGDTTIIGHTGLGEVTNDIVFDENLNLYGVIGSPAEISDFISIDVMTGVGTIIGSVGYQDILGLAYEVTGVTSVEETEDNTIPTEYALSQNYPNPFNPSTSLEFSVPVNSDVTLTIYNLLGQAVATLVNEDINAGNYSVVWNGEDQSGLKVSSGVYLYKMQANGINGGEFQQIRKMVLLK